MYIFLLLIVLCYFVLNCFSTPLSYILFFLGLCVVLILWQCFLFHFFPISTMSSACANIFNCSLPIFVPLGTIFVLRITFCRAELNNRVTLFQSCFICKKGWNCSFYSNNTSCLLYICSTHIY